MRPAIGRSSPPAVLAPDPARISGVGFHYLLAMVRFEMGIIITLGSFFSMGPPSEIPIIPAPSGRLVVFYLDKDQ